MQINVKDYPYGTHLPGLLRCLIRTTGPILEIGSGKFSTPIIDLFSIDRPRVIVENNPHWRGQLENEGMLVDTDVVETVEQALHIHSYYDVALVDGGIVGDRQIHVQMLKDCCTFVVVHDTEDKQYRYDFSMYKYKVLLQELRPWTTLLSNKLHP